MKKFTVRTLGCKANFSDGQLIEAGLLKEGMVSTSDVREADTIIINSCTVTDEADKQSQKMVRDLHLKNPNAKIIYTGCGAEVNPEAALKLTGVTAVIGNQNKDQAPKLISELMNQSEPLSPLILGSVSNYETLKSQHPIDREWAMPSSELDAILGLEEGASTHRTRAFVKIQEGCDSFCTYCIIPYGRGPARSLKIDEIVRSVEKLVTEGVQEVILTGTNIGDYGVDWSGELKIDDLIEAILTKTSLNRLRVSSLDPTEISDRMIELMESISQFCPHFHVSLQHVDSKILKLMKRKYSFTEVEKVLTRLAKMKRQPFVGMDYIVGFPGETDEIFEQSVETLRKLFWTRLHVFPYSERQGTPATRLPGSVERGLRKRRARELQKLSLERLTRFYADKRAEPILGVLLEGPVKGPDGTLNWISGYSKDYQRVIVRAAPHLKRNSVVQVQAKHWIADPASGEVSWMGEA